MVWFFSCLVLSTFTQVFSTVKSQCVTIGPKTLIIVISNKKEARILGNEYNGGLNFAHDSSFL